MSGSEAIYIFDKNVDDLYSLQKRVPSDRILVVEASEKLKSYPEGVTQVLEFFTNCHATRNTRVVAVGGGIIQDVVGFAASVYFRGLKWTFLPTTLLAMADSCVGAKTSINFGSRKNQLGTFHSPTRICIDTEFLKTLQPTEILDGLAEAIKIHVCDNRESDLETSLSQGEWDLERIDYKTIIDGSLRIKKSFIEEDEFDNGRRQFLNYGHTFGHAIEALTRNRISHGFAVALGMDMASYFSLQTQRMSQSEFDRVHSMIGSNYRFSEKLTAGDVSNIITAMKSDKKSVNGVLHFVLKEGDSMILEPFEDLGQVQELLNGYFEEYNITE
ncbi:MAG: 3-dehydroquinate synthase family protein [Verrucomicrobiota bacterium]